MTPELAATRSLPSLRCHASHLITANSKTSENCYQNKLKSTDCLFYCTTPIAATASQISFFWSESKLRGSCFTKGEESAREPKGICPLLCNQQQNTNSWQNFLTWPVGSWNAAPTLSRKISVIIKFNWMDIFEHPVKTRSYTT